LAMGCIAALPVTTETAEELHVDVVKVSGKQLGAVIQEKGGYAVIHSVAARGLLWDWNLGNPSKKVVAGDTLYAANDASGSYWDVIAELEKTGPVRLVLLRGARAKRQRQRPPLSAESMELVHMQYRALRPEDYERLRRLDETVKPTDIVPQELVNELPVHRADECSGMTECQICLEDVTPGELVTRLPCGHGYHRHCVHKWLTQHHGNCPYCSEPVTKLAQLPEVVAGEAPQEAEVISI